MNITIIPRYFVKFGPWAGRFIRFTIVSCFLLLGLVAQAGSLSVETLGAIRFDGIDKSKQYGAGAVLSYDFNKYVAGFGRVISYEDANWGGTAIDEASLGVEARLLQSANGKFTLSAIGAVHRAFGLVETGSDRPVWNQNGDSDLVESWGLGLGGKLKATVYKSLYGFGQGEYRIWQKTKEGDDILLTFGLGLSF